MNIKIPERLINSTIAACRKKLGPAAFQEQGGAVIGRYDNGWIVEDLVFDDQAVMSSGNIHFSGRFFSKTARGLNENQKVLGTWHTHPHNYGTQYSRTDYDCLFHDCMLLATDMPMAVFPRCHLILDIEDARALSAYTYDLPVNYSFTPFESPDLNRCLNSRPEFIELNPMGYLCAGEDGCWELAEYGALEGVGMVDVEPDRIRGFYKCYAGSVIAENLRKIICENYFLKTKQSSFIIAECADDGNWSLMQVKRNFGNGQCDKMQTPPIEYFNLPILWKSDVTAETEQGRRNLRLKSMYRSYKNRYVMRGRRAIYRNRKRRRNI